MRAVSHLLFAGRQISSPSRDLRESPGRTISKSQGIKNYCDPARVGKQSDLRLKLFYTAV
jgi:hypothetical protein